ncbi:MAG: universal stress protein [Chloroflexi bacterium]|nr:universal stress protein [Chloroflexota bacterium]
MYGKILLPVDDLESAGLAISNVKEMAGSNDTHVILFHVVAPEKPLVMHDGHLGGVQTAADVYEVAKHDEAKNVEEQTKVMQAAAEELNAAGLNVTSQVVVGNAPTEIVRAVNEQGIDLVVISTHGRRGVSRAFLGSVADEVMRGLEIPVMVVRRS